jgi:hypothetical protein
VMLWCCAGIALAAALLALAFLPRRAGTAVDAAAQPVPEAGPAATPAPAGAPAMASDPVRPQ